MQNYNQMTTQELQKSEDKLRGQIQGEQRQAKVSAQLSIRSGMRLKPLREELENLRVELGRRSGKKYEPQKVSSILSR